MPGSQFSTALEVIAQIQTGTSASWFALADVIPSGTVCRETDTNRYKVGDGVNPYSALPYAHLTIDYPVGAILLHAGNTAPPGWAICDGSEVDRTTYTQLFEAISTKFGSGNGTSTFNLPNLANRVLSSDIDNSANHMAFINHIIRVSSAVTTI